MANTAIKPNYFHDFKNLESLKPPAVKDEGILDEETKDLARLHEDRGWKVFLDRSGKVMDDLDELVRTQMFGGADEASIGRSTIVKEITKDVIRRLLNIVQDAYESVEGRAGAGGN